MRPAVHKAPPHLPLGGGIQIPKAQIAQLVEQLAFNQLVLGSSPSLRTSFITRFTLRGKRTYHNRAFHHSQSDTRVVSP